MHRFTTRCYFVTLLRRHAGVRQLQQLTGIGKNIISNVSKNILADRTVTCTPVLIEGIDPQTKFHT